MGSKKHKKHKSERKDRYEEKQFGVDKPPGLKLILKVGSSSTPEHSSDSPGPIIPPAQSNNYSVAPTTGDEESRQSAASLLGREETHIDRQHRKAKKKKKKKEKDKEKHERKHKHHHKFNPLHSRAPERSHLKLSSSSRAPLRSLQVQREKRKRPRDESSQDDVSVGEESLSDPPLPNKRMATTENSCVNSKQLNQTSDCQNSAPGSGSEQGSQASREPRSCVLRQRQERSALQKLLDHLLRSLEKRDPQQFFAWPVTDHIAPGYSQIIHHPMDFSSMKQKIDDNLYATLNDFMEDFKLMCNNAMVYNHPETIYYKAAKKLLHVGLKMMSPDKLKPLRSVLTYMPDISQEELGFELGQEEVSLTPSAQADVESMDDIGATDENDEAEIKREHKRKLKESNRPLSKFEAIPDDLSPEEILEQAQKAAQVAADKLSMKRMNTKMGFLRQNKDGSTSLAILVPGDGVTPGTNERPISLGMLSGKLTHGTGQLQGFREDRRNLAKAVKPLYYGAFGSYAPSYDSTFANLTKEESELVFQTYGDETAVQYAESILDFSKDCDYTLTMVDNLLDLLTGGEHRKTKKILEERRRLREEEDRIRQMLEGKVNNSADERNLQSDLKSHISGLKSLADIGLDTKFLDVFEKDLLVSREETLIDDPVQSRLDQTSSLLQKLQQVQNDRLSQPPPQHLSQVPHPSDNEVQLAEKITENLKDMAKKVSPGSITAVSAIRKAMGILPNEPPRSSVSQSVASKGEVLRTEPDQNDTTAMEVDVTEGTNSEVEVILSESVSSEQIIEVDVEGTSSQAETEEATVSLVPDLESELREFLESEPALSNSPLQDDKTIEEILSES